MTPGAARYWKATLRSRACIVSAVRLRRAPRIVKTVRENSPGYRRGSLVPGGDNWSGRETDRQLNELALVDAQVKLACEWKFSDNCFAARAGQ